MNVSPTILELSIIAGVSLSPSDFMLRIYVSDAVLPRDHTANFTFWVDRGFKTTDRVFVKYVDQKGQFIEKKMAASKFLSLHENSQKRTSYNLISRVPNDSNLRAQYQTPGILREVDLCERNTAELRENVALQDMYLLCSEAKCVTPFHVDFSGTCVMYFQVYGEKHWRFCTSTEQNINALLENPNNERAFLKAIDRLYAINVIQGDVLFLPPRMPHMVYTDCGTVALAANFLRIWDVCRSATVIESEMELGDWASIYPDFYPVVIGALSAMAEDGTLGEYLSGIVVKMLQDIVNLQLVPERYRKDIRVRVKDLLRDKYDRLQVTVFYCTFISVCQIK